MTNAAPLQLDLDGSPEAAALQAEPLGPAFVHRARGPWRTFLPTVLARIFGLRTALNVWQWAEANIILDAQASPSNPGQYQSSNTPYTRFIMELFHDPKVREIIVKKSSQSGATEAILNIIRFCVANQPCNILYVIDSVEEVKKIFRIRLVPTLERCPATAQQITPNDDDVTARTLYLRDMFIMGVGGHSEGALANKPVTIGILDEADKHPRSTEGRTVDQLRARFKTVANSKLFLLSKPVEETDVTTVEFNSGTQHKFYVPCFHCGEFQEMVQERVRYDHCRDLTGEKSKERVLTDTVYLCINSGTPKCKDGRMTEAQRRVQVHKGEWRQTNFRDPDPGKVSLEITDLISLFPKCTLGEIALDLIAAQKSMIKMKHVQAERFAKGWKGKGISLGEDQIYKLCGPYLRTTIPFEPVLVVLTVDVQGDVQKWVKHGFLADGTHYIIDWGYTMAVDELMLVWLGEEPHRPVRVASSDVICEPHIGIIDEGYKTNEIRSFVNRANASGQFWRTSKGRGGFQVKTAVVESNYEHEGIPSSACHYNDDVFKQELYLGQIGDLDRIVRGVSKLPRLWLPRKQDVDHEFAVELCAEELREAEDDHGFIRRRWEKIGEANDFGDNVKMGKVAWHLLGHQAVADYLALLEARKAAAATPA